MFVVGIEGLQPLVDIHVGIGGESFAPFFEKVGTNCFRANGWVAVMYIRVDAFVYACAVAASAAGIGFGGVFAIDKLSKGNRQRQTPTATRTEKDSRMGHPFRAHGLGELLFDNALSYDVFKNQF